MNLKKTLCLTALSFVALVTITGFDSRSADAQSSITVSRTYKVQVEYWFFDTDYYYWSTKLETNSQAEAQFLRDVLQLAKENGQLNAVAPNSYWRYIAVDVRMVVKYDWNWMRPDYYELNPWQFQVID